MSFSIGPVSNDTYIGYFRDKTSGQLFRWIYSSNPGAPTGKTIVIDDPQRQAEILKTINPILEEAQKDLKGDLAQLHSLSCTFSGVTLNETTHQKNLQKTLEKVQELCVGSLPPTVMGSAEKTTEAKQRLSTLEEQFNNAREQLISYYEQESNLSRSLPFSEEHIKEGIANLKAWKAKLQGEFAAAILDNAPWSEQASKRIDRLDKLIALWSKMQPNQTGTQANIEETKTRVLEAEIALKNAKLAHFRAEADLGFKRNELAKSGSKEPAVIHKLDLAVKELERALERAQQEEERCSKQHKGALEEIEMIQELRSAPRENQDLIAKIRKEAHTLNEASSHLEVELLKTRKEVAEEASRKVTSNVALNILEESPTKAKRARNWIPQWPIDESELTAQIKKLSQEVI